ncbi:uncharacterized protein LOC105647870 isoform X2 [Jatropha curcas]|uniref:uncharacterized protein LOC105647870 isoform X2 n=1 Tax=Jatropha curcas TaxID=180498 RepID=UPI001894D8E3|nr:uncharacterized protein LOC105647870 isoform X2 [Jatropha curcas]
MTSLLLLQRLPVLSSSLNHSLPQNSGHHPSLISVKTRKVLQSKRLTVPLLALTESSDSSQSLDESSQSLLQQLTCGQELGELLLNLSRAWELADTSTSRDLASKLPMLESNLTSKAKAAFGKRLVSAGRRFQSMGQYGQGEMQKVAQAMIRTGKLLSANPIPTTTDEEPKKETRVFKFGELQVAVTAEKANIGAAIAVAFGILSWELGQGIQSIPESSLQYANDNALLLAKSLRGALLVLFYCSALLSASTSVGLFLLGRELKSEEK